MNTNIEQITSEQTIGEIQYLALDDNMLTTALSKPYADATGLGEVQPSAPVSSDVEEMPSWMTYLLRKMFGTTTKVFRGVSLLSEFRAVYSWLRNRLKGTTDGVIPSVALDPSKPMSEHLRLLDSRKMDDGLTIKLSDGTITSLPDGLSLAQLLFGVSPDGTDFDSSITGIVDTNKGWTMTKAISGFPNLKKLNLSAKSIFGKFRASEHTLDELQAPYLEYIGIGNLTGSTYVTQYCRLAKTINCEELVLPSLSRIQTTTAKDQTSAVIENLPNCKRILLPSLTDIRTEGSAWLGRGTGTFVFCSNAPECEELITNISGDTNKDNTSASYYFINAPKLRKFVVGYLTTNNDKGLWNTTSTELIHLEIGGATCSLDMRDWSPTNAISERLGEFLSNFQTYIADRVVDRTNNTALTLTLSAAVYEALQAQEGQTILATLTNKNWTVAQA